MNQPTIKKMAFGLILVTGLAGPGEIVNSTIVRQGGYFFEKSIPCKEYLKIKHRVEQKSGVAVAKAIFQAKVQIVGAPIKPKELNEKALRLKVIEVLEGRVPSDQFIAHYSGPSGHPGLPYNHKEDKFYFVVGRGHGGNIRLMRIGSNFSNGQNDFSFIEWFWGLFSECENV